MDTDHSSGKKHRVRRTALFFAGAVLLLIIASIVVSAITEPADSVYTYAPEKAVMVTKIVQAAGVGYEPTALPAATQPAAADTPIAPNEQSTSAISRRVIIREGYISLVVEDTQASKQAITEIVAEMEAEGAFVVASNEQGAVDDQMPTIYITIRVPSNRFDEVMERLAAMSVRVSQRREDAQDVTEEYVDLQARLESMEAARDRLREIMQEAETVEELLLAEQQLAEREAEIAAIQGRLKYLSQAAQLSKIEISLYPAASSQPIAPRWQPGETAREALEGLVKSAQGAVDIAIYFGIAILPWLIASGLVMYGAYHVARRYRGGHNRNKHGTL